MVKDLGSQLYFNKLACFTAVSEIINLKFENKRSKNIKNLLCDKPPCWKLIVEPCYNSRFISNCNI